MFLSARKVNALYMEDAPGLRKLETLETLEYCGQYFSSAA